MVDVGHLHAEVAVAAAKETLKKMWVCTACKGVYFAPINGACPGCKGTMTEQDVRFDAAGVAHVKTD